MAVLLLVSAASNVVLSLYIVRVNRMTRQMGRTIERLTLASEAQPGVWVPPLETIDQKGQKVSFVYVEKESPTILYIFSPQCDWCTRNLESMKALEQQTHAQYRFLALSTSDQNLDTYLRQTKIDFPVYRPASNDSLYAYKVSSTPQTMVISGNGRVVKNWGGAYVGATMKQIEEFFNVKLPRLGAMKGIGS